LQQIIDARGMITKLCEANKLAMIEGQLKKWEFIGSGKSWQEFEDISRDGGILVGFYYFTNGNERPLEAMQPIFLSPRGETKGVLCGASNNPLSRRVTKAKPGYAIGAIQVWADPKDQLLSLKPIYMKIIDKGLDPNKQYVGPQMSGNVGETKPLSADGNFIVGIGGKITAADRLSTFSILALTTRTPVAEADAKKK
jgi:hypothetical protein